MRSRRPVITYPRPQFQVALWEMAIPLLPSSIVKSWRQDQNVAMTKATTGSPQAADESSLLQEMVDALRAAEQPERVILFGSRARGDARPDSDFDLLIVQPAQAGKS